jgi:threonine/homoserine/homoserine lactone efflux protein
MFETTTLLAFIGASMIVLLTPGPGVLYVVTRGAVQGRRAGVVSAAGLSAGAFVHVIAAVVGLSAILATSATAFNIVKLAGAAYLIWIGVQALRSRGGLAKPDSVTPQPMRRLFLDGVVISIFNPKIAIFFLAYLPLFTDPAAGSVTLQLAVLGCIYCGLAFVSDSAYAILASGASGWFRDRMLNSSAMRYVTGSIFVGLGIHAALATQQK